MPSSHPDLTGFKALSFDCYGTLIDWETGIQNALSPLISQLPSSHPFKTNPPTAALQRLGEITSSHEARTPAIPYNELLVMSLSDLARELGQPLPDSISEPFGNAVGTWLAFPDTVPGLQKLGRHYKLVILSNVDSANMAATVDRQLAPARFDAVYTAQDVGSYKPARRNFEYLFGHAKRDLGVDWEKGELLHVARSLGVDHVPAKEMGLRSVWISRGGDKEGYEGVGGKLETYKDSTAFEWRFDTIRDFADEVERQFAAKKA
ncbi:HAD-like domain-containing protein [Hypoxylon argillaceum]|nr:HAD-like domain-containing protein [Hypoxylon argillaceum]KAI1153180.1 HAD-like domain-containing protein [Nemania diffusa]